MLKSDDDVNVGLPPPVYDQVIGPVALGETVCVSVNVLSVDVSIN
jgi:hypothetical protein